MSKETQENGNKKENTTHEGHRRKNKTTYREDILQRVEYFKKIIMNKLTVSPANVMTSSPNKEQVQPFREKKRRKKISA